jgi:hypothetical protein
MAAEFDPTFRAEEFEPATVDDFGTVRNAAAGILETCDVFYDYSSVWPINFYAINVSTHLENSRFAPVAQDINVRWHQFDTNDPTHQRLMIKLGERTINGLLGHEYFKKTFSMGIQNGQVSYAVQGMIYPKQAPSLHEMVMDPQQWRQAQAGGVVLKNILDTMHNEASRGDCELLAEELIHFAD